MRHKIIYHFDWDRVKARTNQSKHGVSFRRATAVFHDALAVTIYDDGHSDTEDRWVTIGCEEGGRHLVVVHTFHELSATEIRVRLISARTADRQEIAAYEETPR